MEASNSLWGWIKQLASLGGIVVLAVANLALSSCDTRSVKEDSGPDAGTTVDATVETAPKPDARLWDVLCE